MLAFLFAAVLLLTAAFAIALGGAFEMYESDRLDSAMRYVFFGLMLSTLVCGIIAATMLR